MLLELGVIIAKQNIISYRVKQLGYEVGQIIPKLPH